MFSSQKNLFTNFSQRLLTKSTSILIPLQKFESFSTSLGPKFPIYVYHCRFPLSRRNPSSRVSRFKCVSVAGSFASHVSKVNNAIRVRAKVTGRQRERQTGEESTFLPSLFSLSRGKYVEYLNKSKQPK